MARVDGRRMSHKALEEIRKMAVARVQDGESPEAVIALLGFNRTTIYRWLAAYHAGGEDALKAKPLNGRPRILADKHLKWLFRVVRKDPRQLRFPFGLWTREMLAQEMKRKFPFLEVSRQTIGRALKVLGLSCQKPLYRATQQNPEAVKAWLDEEYPRIKEEAKATGADIFFEDEAGIRSDYHSGTTWGLRGKTPVVRKTGRRFSVNMISAVSARGKLRFMVLDRTVTGKVFLVFLKRLLIGAKRPIFLIVDRHPAHVAKPVKRFVEETAGKLKLFFLPPYSPELNPDELVWNCVKSKVSRRGVRSQDELRGAAAEELQRLQRSPVTVQALFKEKHVCYAAL